MKAWLLVAMLALAAVPAAVPGASAAPGDAWVVDAEGDVRASAGFTGQGAPVSAGDSAAADLLALDLVESDDAVTFTVLAKTLKSTAGGARYEVRWDFGEYGYLIILNPPTGGGAHRADLYVIEESERSFRFSHVARLDSVSDESAGSIRIPVPKEYIQDEDEKSPVVGDRLTGLYARSSLSVLFSNFLFEFTDRVPDMGDAPAFNFSKGGFSTGHLVLASDDPFRVSNGGSHTYLIQATLQNNAAFDDDARLSAVDLPEGWDVTIPTKQRVPAMGSVNVNVLVSLPFAHDHGGVSEFLLKAESGSKRDAYTTLRMGVLHTPIPQPAGHHDELFFHANQTGGTDPTLPFQDGTPMTMNTEADHTDDVTEVAPNTANFRISDRAQWISELNPGLGIGLDFDLLREGLMTATFLPKTPGTARALLTLYLDTGEDFEELASGESAVQDVSANTKATFAFPVKVKEKADYIPYTKGQNLVVVLSYESLTVEAGTGGKLTPTLLIGESSLKLPLNEYRDIVTAVDAQGARLELEAAGPLEKKAQPGSTMTYSFNLTNNGPEEDTFVVEVAGADAHVGSAVPSTSFTLKSGESRSVVLGVSVPYEAQREEQFEVLLLARSQTDPSNMAVARTYTTVSFGIEASPDETQQLLAAQGNEQETPGIGAALLVPALLGAALLSRRKR